MTGRTVPVAAVTGAEMVAARAATDPEWVALSVGGGADLTYDAWETRSNAIARGLAARGVGPGGRVGLLFDGSRWADFAAANLGVSKAGGVAVLLSPGAAVADLDRAVSHSGAVGVLCAPRAVHLAAPVWVADPEEMAAEQDVGPVAPPAGLEVLAELGYPPAPLARPRPEARSHAYLAGDAGPAVDGWLVHAWAPGSRAGQRALRQAQGGDATRVATLAAFTPDSLGALVAERRAVACGLTSALAAAVVASGAPQRYDLGSVSRVVLSDRPSPGLRARLEAAFPGAEVAEMAEDGGPAPPAAAPTAGQAAPAPVAASQEGMLWHEQFTPGSFNMPCLVRRYEGPLDVAALGWALAELVRRHQPLRSTFEVLDGQARQIVGADRAPELAVVDLGGLPPADREAEVAGMLADATSRPFDLANGPLFQPRLVRLGPDDHLLVVRLHHTVFDDWSVDVFRRELSALYGARVAGEPSPLVEPATSFADFCRRQRALIDGGAGAEQLSWWRRELDGAPLSVQLPLGDDSGRARPQAGEPLRVDLPPELASALRALAPRLRATPYMTVLAAFSALVAGTTNQDDLVMAAVVAHRNRSQLEPLVGCFTKKVPLRLRLDGDPSFADLVARTRASLLGALSHQDVAFDAAVQEGLGGPAAEHGVVPQVTVVFQGETPQQVKLALPGLAVSRFEVPGEARRERHFSCGPEEPEKAAGEGEVPAWGDGIYLGTFLILSLLETGDGLALVARGTFHRPAVQRLLERLQTLLADVAAEPSRRVSELSAVDLASGDGTADATYDDPADGDVVEVRGFRARRSRLEAALARCPGVAEVAVAVRHDAGEPRLVAYVVTGGGDPPPTLARLRHALWARLPGALWPAAAVVVVALPRLPDGRLDAAALPPPGRPGSEPSDPDPHPVAALLSAMWGEARGRPARPGLSYWQDFSFLQVLTEARQAGVVITDEQVARNRTTETLAADLATARPRRGPGADRPRPRRTDVA